MSQYIFMTMAGSICHMGRRRRRRVMGVSDGENWEETNPNDIILISVSIDTRWERWATI